jgi:hypothetical protein
MTSLALSLSLLHLLFARARGLCRACCFVVRTGSGEREDVLAVCRYLQSECGVEAVYLVGYSYGSAIGCSVVNDVDIIKVRHDLNPICCLFVCVCVCVCARARDRSCIAKHVAMRF